MDHTTKVECGLKTEGSAPSGEEADERGNTEQSAPIECSGNNTPVQSQLDGYWYCDYAGTGEGEMTFEEQCQAGILGAENGCSNADTPQDEGSTSYVPEGTSCDWADDTTVYCEGPGGSYSYQQDPGDLPHYDPSNGGN